MRATIAILLTATWLQSS